MAFSGEVREATGYRQSNLALALGANQLERLYKNSGPRRWPTRVFNPRSISGQRQAVKPGIKAGVTQIDMETCRVPDQTGHSHGVGCTTDAIVF